MSVLSIEPLLDRRRRGIIYSRISKDEAGDELGVERHVRECLRLAQDHGITVDPAHVFVDDDRSGFKAGVRRKDWEAAQALMRTGAFGNLVTKDPDRLHRQDLRVTEDLIDLLRGNDVMLLSVNSGMFDLNTVDGRERARGAAVRARAESERSSKRLRDKMIDLAQQGKPNGGPRPYGYQRQGHAPRYRGEEDTRKLVIDRAEAKVVKEIIARVAAGETLTRIADDLNARGVKTSRGGRWTVTNTRRIAINGLYAGRRIHKGVEQGPGTWPAIVEEALWRQAVAVLTDPARLPRRSPRRYLLTGGLLLCGKCLKPLFSKPHHQGGTVLGTYACKSSSDREHPGCGGVSIRADQVEKLVSEWVLTAVESPDFAQSITHNQKANPKAVADARALETQLDQLADTYAAGKITMREWQRARDGVAQRLELARASVTSGTTFAAVGRYAGKKGALRAVWPGLDLDQRQAIVRSVIESITIAPVGKGKGKVFDPGRVGDPVWRV